ncbi:hypothetical protein [Flavisphingomonas formosensis]|uniref:hypothetical protein n=1 Tax=Flavisphingomonas formosensis TaxID=861534 RepID=UPI0012FB695F|nr:hypothetical protein [Sphingomonas formosensis]
MEKLIYVLWKDPAESDAAFNDRLRGPVGEQLAKLGAQRLQFNIVDDAVADGAALRFEPVKPAPSALVSFWLNAAHARAPFEAVLEGAAPRFAGYQVAESTVVPNDRPSGSDGRVRGFSQIAFLFKLPAVTYDGFLEMWMRDQTRVGVETQDTFYYCQNIVVRVLTPGAPMWNGIVEECYPIEALTDPLVFWKANGDEAVYKANYAREMANVARFLDLERGSVMITSAYRPGGWADPKHEIELYRG